MSRMIKAVVEKDGSLRLLEDIKLKAGEQVLVTVHASEPGENDTALLSEAALATDWERQEEDEAWAHLQN